MFDVATPITTAERQPFAALLTSLRKFVGALEPGEYAAADVPVMLKDFSEAERLCGTARLLMANRAAELKSHSAAGAANPVQLLEAASGEAPSRVRRDLETAKRLSDQPALEAALRDGSVSPTQASLISPALAADPDSADQLLNTARNRSFRDLKRDCDLVIAASRSEEEELARQERLHAARSLCIGLGPDGSMFVRGELDPIAGAVVKHALDAEANKAAGEVPRGERREARGAYLADALQRLCSRGSGSSSGEGPRAEIVLHVSAEALRRGELHPGEQCEIEGVGPVALATVEYLFGNSFAKLIITKGKDVAAITHFGRWIPSHIDTALRDRDRTCAVPGCDISYGLERDHIVPVEDGGPTELANLVRLCKRHHYLKTHKRWRLLGGPGEWEWVKLGAGGEAVAGPDGADTGSQGAGGDAGEPGGTHQSRWGSAATRSAPCGHRSVVMRLPQEAQTRTTTVTVSARSDARCLTGPGQESAVAGLTRPRSARLGRSSRAGPQPPRVP